MFDKAFERERHEAMLIDMIQARLTWRLLVMRVMRDTHDADVDITR